MSPHLVLAFLLAHAVNAQCPPQCVCRAGATIVDCSRRKLIEVPSGLPTTTMQLILAGNRIAKLGDDALSGLYNLTSLDASSNQLTTISVNAFRGCCSRLEIIKLTSNKISALPTIAFDSLPSLRVLHLTENRFSLIPEVGSSGSPNLEELYMENNRLTSPAFPSSYSGSKKLTRITLSNNLNIQKVSTGDFASLKECAVRRLYLSRCQIRSIEVGSLSVLTSLSSLTIGQNPLGFEGFTSLMQELQSARSLESLGVSDVQLDKPLTPQLMTVNGRSSLRVLDISKNSIPSIEDYTFRNMSGLHDLDLSSADLQTLGERAFDGLSNLVELRLPNNGLARLAPFPPSVTKLDLTGNKVQYLSSGSFASLSKLTWLNLRGNGLQRAENDAFRGLFALKWLDVSYNSMPSLSPDLLSPLVSLTFFNASNNKIKLPISKVSLFASQQNLATLDLSNNNMDSISWRMLTGLNSVKYFNLSHNNLGVCFGNCTCSEEVFSNLGTVEEIDLSSNGITVLPRKLFHNLTVLRVLRLSKNGFLSWDNLDLFSGDRSLVSLFLDSNQISLLNSTSFANLPSLRSVNLRDNPLACSCDMVWFRKWINATQIELSDLSEYTCHSPPDATGKPFLQFDPATLVCTNPPIVLISAILSAAFASVLVTLSVTYRYRWKIRFRIYKASCGRPGQSRPGYEPLAGQVFLYAAYISYCRSPKCKAEVVERLMPQVDGDCDGGAASTCIVHIDEKFQPNRSVIANVVEAIDTSAVFLVFLCPHYRSNRLCELELELAFTQQLDEGGDRRRRCLVVMFGDLSPKCIPRLLTPTFEKGEHWKWAAEDADSQRRLCEVLRDQLSHVGVSERGQGNAVADGAAAKEPDVVPWTNDLPA